MTAETLWQRVWGWARTLDRFALAAPLCVTLTGLGCIALAASSDLANTFDAPRAGGPIVATLLFLTLLAAFACWIAAAHAPGTTQAGSSQRQGWGARWRHLLVYPVLLWALLTAGQTVAVLGEGIGHDLTQWPVQYGSDDLYYNHYNALLVLAGENPYAGPWLAQEVRYFHNLAYTPIARGRFADPHHYPTRAQMDAVVRDYLAHPQTPPPELDPATTHSYPAGAFLVALPAVWAGLPSVGVTQFALLVALLVMLVARTPSPWRWVVGLLVLADADGARQVVGSDFEIWPLALLTFAWMARERRWLPGLLLGAACAIKQTAWLATPFYLIWVWRARGPTEALRQGGIALGAFAAINLPWIVASPSEWLSSLALPVRLPLLPDGSGIVALSLGGGLPLAPSWVYGVFELAALAVALVWYWRDGYARFPYAALVLPALPLVLAWRSSERYFVLLPVAAAVALALTLETMRRRGAMDSKWPAQEDAGAAPASTGR